MSNNDKAGMIRKLYLQELLSLYVMWRRYGPSEEERNETESVTWLETCSWEM